MAEQSLLGINLGRPWILSNRRIYCLSVMPNDDPPGALSSRLWDYLCRLFNGQRLIVGKQGIENMAKRPRSSRHPDVYLPWQHQHGKSMGSHSRLRVALGSIRGDLAATLDWYSRYVVSWKLSNRLESSFCLDMLEEAFSMVSSVIFNTDQETQFTSNAWIEMVQEAGVQVSMDGKGRCFGNIFVERLGWIVKYENVYLKGYENPRELREGLKSYFRFYNEKRPHQALGYKSPVEIHQMADSLRTRISGA